MTVARTAMRTTAIPVTVGTFEMHRKHEGLKVMKVTRLVNPTGPIPVPREVGGWGAYHGKGGLQTENRNHIVIL